MTGHSHVLSLQGNRRGAEAAEVAETTVMLVLRARKSIGPPEESLLSALSGLCASAVALEKLYGTT